jgi:hypothetical protein
MWQAKPELPARNLDGSRPSGYPACVIIHASQATIPYEKAILQSKGEPYVRIPLYRAV